MKRIVELKHVGPRGHVQVLLEELISRLEEKLSQFPSDAVSLHVLFDENGSHKLYRMALTCHIPRHTVAAHEEGREAGAVIRRAFAELERQLDKRKATMRHEYSRRRSRRTGRTALVVLLALLAAPPGGARAGSAELSPAAADALRLIESDDAYQRQLGFLRLEALREPSAATRIRAYADDKDEELRAQALRALAAVQGAGAIPLLLEKLRTDKRARVRRAALLGLEPLAAASPEVLPALIAALKDRKTDVRMSAVDIVSRIDDPRAREAIRQRHKRERRKDVRRVLAAAVKRLKEE